MELFGKLKIYRFLRRETLEQKFDTSWKAIQLSRESLPVACFVPETNVPFTSTQSMFLFLPSSYYTRPLYRESSNAIPKSNSHKEMILCIESSLSFGLQDWWVVCEIGRKELPFYKTRDHQESRKHENSLERGERDFHGKRRDSSVSVKTFTTKKWSSDKKYVNFIHFN